MVKRRALGRGLDALLGGVADPPARQGARPDPADAAEDGGFRRLPVDLIRRGKHQPRRIVEEATLEELAQSVRTRGIVQPIRGAPGGLRGLRDRGGRAALAGRPDGRTRRSAGGGARLHGPGGRRDRADREHPARGPQPHRGGAGLPLPRRRVRTDPPGTGGHRGALAFLGVERTAPSRSQRGRPRHGGARRARHGAREGPALALRPRPERGGGGGGAAGALGPRDREAGALQGARRVASAAQGPRPRTW